MKKTINILVVMLFIFSMTINGQTARNLTIEGVVYDNLNNPLPGVTIVLKHAPTIGTSTDVDGNFIIKAAKDNILVFQMVGMTPFEYLVEKSVDDLKVVLEEDTQTLEELVVTGVTSQKKVSIAGAITTVDVEELKTPATSLNNMLGGRVAGVITNMSSGEPGKNISNFWIRGIGTFGANAGALVLIDGLEGRLEDIDPDDLESFSVLKDAAATAVYGVRGANGVVLITTRKGVPGKINISARVTTQISHLKRLPQYLESYDYAMLANEARAVSGDKDIYSTLELDVIKNNLDPDLFPNVNWFDEMLNKTSMQQRYFMSASGGGEKATYYLSLGGQFEGAAYKQNESKYKKPLAYNKITYRSNIDMFLTPKTKLKFQTDGHITSHTLPGRQNTNSLWNAAQMITPLMFPVKYSDGTLPTYGTEDMSSPYTNLNHTGYATSNHNRNMIALELTQQVGGIFKGLTLTAQVQSDLNTYNNESRTIRPAQYRATGRDSQGNLIKSIRLSEQTVSFSNGQNYNRKYFFQGKADWKRTYDKHDLGALLLYYMEDYKDGNWKGNLGIDAIPARRQNLSGRLSYGFDNTYFVDANFGYTGSSQFKKGERFGLFPSLALAWVPSSYDWFQESVPFISFLKIRGSYGTSGNDQISSNRFPYLTLINNNASTGWGYRESGITEQQVGADNLKWEVAKKTNIGVEINFLDDRLQVVADIFRDQRDDIFMTRVTLPDYLGLTNLPYSNVGRMHSFGTDGNVSYSHRINNDMGFNIRGNWTFSQNNVDYFEQNDLPYDYLNYSGKPLYIARGYIAEGLFKDREEIETSADQSGFGRVRPGDIKYRDVNGDGRINGDDQVPLSYTNQLPRMMYGIGGDFSWKNLTVGVLFRGSSQVKYYRTASGYNGWMPFQNGETGNVLKLANNPANRWTPAWYSGDPATENPNAEFPRLSYGGNNNNNQLSTFWQRDGSYLRLQEVSVRYRIKDKNWLNVAGLSSIDIDFVANNLFTIDKVKYFDPEQAHHNGGSYPIPTSYTLQLYLNF